MEVYPTGRFEQQLKDFFGAIAKKMYKQVDYLIENLRHPSLHAKKYDEVNDIWQARVDDSVRFYFKIEKDHYLLLAIKKHPK